MAAASEPRPNCPLCPRLAAFRRRNRAAETDGFNRPVPSFGSLDAWLLVVGLAPGLKGANRTGRPFTGDHAGRLLYPTLAKFGLARGTYGESRDDGLRLVGARITNAVRCVPPANKPLPAEIGTCASFLRAEIAALPRLKAIIALGVVAHGATLAALDLPKTGRPFAHGARHALPNGPVLFDSYHCSRYNTQTGRLTPAMFDSVFAAVTRELGVRPPP